MKYIIIFCLIATNFITQASAWNLLGRSSSNLVSLIKIDEGSSTQILMQETLFFLNKKRLFIQDRNNGKIKRLSSIEVKRIVRFKNVILALDTHSKIAIWYKSPEGKWQQGDLPATDKAFAFDNEWFQSYVQWGRQHAGVQSIKDLMISENTVLALGMNGRVYTYSEFGAEVKMKPIEGIHVAGRYGVEIKSAVPLTGESPSYILKPLSLTNVVSFFRFKNGFGFLKADQSVEFLNHDLESCQALLQAAIN